VLDDEQGILCGGKRFSSSEAYLARARQPAKPTQLMVNGGRHAGCALLAR